MQETRWCKRDAWTCHVRILRLTRVVASRLSEKRTGYQKFFNEFLYGFTGPDTSNNLPLVAALCQLSSELESGMDSGTVSILLQRNSTATRSFDLVDKRKADPCFEVFANPLNLRTVLRIPNLSNAYSSLTQPVSLCNLPGTFKMFIDLTRRYRS